MTSKTYETPILNQKKVGTPATDHNVGQMQNNLHKVKRILEKTGFVQKMDEEALVGGESSTVLKLVHHLMFRASERFT